MFLAAVHLANDLHRLARLVVHREEKDRRVHHPRRFLIERPEQLREVAGFCAQRAKPTRRLESGAELVVFRWCADHPNQTARKSFTALLVLAENVPMSQTQLWLARSPAR